MKSAKIDIGGSGWCFFLQNRVCLAKIGDKGQKIKEYKNDSRLPCPNPHIYHVGAQTRPVHLCTWDNYKPVTTSLII